MLYSLKLTGLLTATALLTAGAAAAQKKPAARPAAPAGGYVLQGTLAAPNATKVYLTRVGSREIKDSTVVKDGHFAFRGRVSEPTLAYLNVPAAKRYAQFFVENVPLTVTFLADKEATAAVKGGTAEAELLVYDKQWAQTRRKAGVVYKMLADATPAGQQEPTAAARQEGDARFAEISKEMKADATAFVQQYPNSPVAAYVVNARFVEFPDEPVAAELYKQLGPAAQASHWGKSINSYLTVSAKSALGSTLDFAQADASGKQVKISDFRGKYVLVDFWASWCGPCRKENPNVVKLYNQYHAKGFDIVGVSLDSKKAAWEKAVAADGLAWTHVSDLQGWKNAVALEYGIGAVPQSFLLDPEGKVIAKNLRGEELQAKLAEVFAAKP